MHEDKNINLIILDNNPAWVKALAKGIRNVGFQRCTVFEYEVYGLSYAIRSGNLIRSKRDNNLSRRLLLPGWNRFPKISSSICLRQLRRRIRGFLNKPVIVFTNPWYSDVAAKLPDAIKLYYAYDYYREYIGWKSEEIIARERVMMNSCNMAFGISPTLVKDLEALGPAPVYLSPNAASTGFLNDLESGVTSTPKEIEDLPHPVIGCVGQINYRSYDWDFIDGLAAAFPQYSFVFVGQRTDETTEEAERVNAIFSRDNVHWLGVRPHASIPSYLQSFDICLNPLAVNPFNQRRSLLRFYDYLSTDRPILSTAINNAYEHNGHIEVAENVEMACRILRKMLSSEYRIDTTARRQYISANTWDDRARNFIHCLEKLA